MSKNTQLLLFLFALIFFFPDDKKNGGNAVEKLDKYVAAQYEGYIAYVANDNAEPFNPPAPTPPNPPTPPNNNVVGCKCNGTGQLKMVDGNYRECDCGPNCTCKAGRGSSGDLQPVTEDLKKKTLPPSTPFPPLKMISEI